MKTMVVIGAGGHCRPVLSTLALLEEWRVEGVVDIHFEGQEETIMGRPVIGGADALEEAAPDALFLAIGENALREEWAGRLEGRGFAFPSLVNPHAWVDPSARIGRGNLVAHGAYVGPMVTAGDFNIFNTNSVTEHETEVESFCHLGPASVLCGRCRMGRGALLGAGAVAIPGVRLGKEVVVGAQAAVTGDLPDGRAVYAGVPAGRRS